MSSFPPPLCKSFPLPRKFLFLHSIGSPYPLISGQTLGFFLFIFFFFARFPLPVAVFRSNRPVRRRPYSLPAGFFSQNQPRCHPSRLLRHEGSARQGAPSPPFPSPSSPCHLSPPNVLPSHTPFFFRSRTPPFPRIRSPFRTHPFRFFSPKVFLDFQRNNLFSRALGVPHFQRYSPFRSYASLFYFFPDLFPDHFFFRCLFFPADSPPDGFDSIWVLRPTFGLAATDPFGHFFDFRAAECCLRLYIVHSEVSCVTLPDAALNFIYAPLIHETSPIPPPSTEHFSSDKSNLFY